MRWMRVGVIGMLVATAPATAAAQRRSHLRMIDRPPAEVGVRGGYSWSTGVDSWSWGVQARLPITDFLEVIPSGDYYVVDLGHQYQGNLDLVANFGWTKSLYAGGGVALSHRDFGNALALAAYKNEVGPHVLVGVEFGRIRRMRVRPFGQLSWTFLHYGGQWNTIGAGQFGLNFSLGR